VQHDTPFERSPFGILADEKNAGCWAGRRDVLKRLERLVKAWSGGSDSTLDVMWANLGAGKTHALFHLKHLLLSDSRTSAVQNLVAFVELPEDVRNFLELYRLIIRALHIRAVAIKALSDPTNISAKLERAFRAIVHGSSNERLVAEDWIGAGNPQMRELRGVTGIDARIESDSDAEAILSEIVKLLGDKKHRLVVLIDEFQRIGRLPARRRDALLSHLRTLFSRNATDLSVVLAIGSRAERTALDLIPAELKTLLGMRPLISLPEMGKEEAIEFVRERFCCFRPSGFSGRPEAPFTTEQLGIVVSYMCDTAHVHLTPRILLQVLGLIEAQFRGDDLSQVSSQDVMQQLSGMRWDEGS
jgi:hypothetical protein